MSSESNGSLRFARTVLDCGGTIMSSSSLLGDGIISGTSMCSMVEFMVIVFTV